MENRLPIHVPRRRRFRSLFTHDAVTILGIPISISLSLLRPLNLPRAEPGVPAECAALAIGRASDGALDH
jgi:hypothetical protein